jgi:hypothetical protein
MVCRQSLPDQAAVLDHQFLDFLAPSDDGRGAPLEHR